MIALFIAKDGINLDDRKIGYCTLLLCIFTLNAAFSVVIKKNKLQSPNFATPFFYLFFSPKYADDIAVLHSSEEV